jgi:hypothetical protein
MASADVLPSTSSSHGPSFKHIDTATVNVVKRKRSASRLPNPLLKMAVLDPPKVAFDPSRHLSFQAPKKVWSMEELGFAESGVSPNAVSEPFQLFTEDAIKQMRAEVLSKAVLDNCQYSSNIAQCQLRGMAPQ